MMSEAPALYPSEADIAVLVLGKRAKDWSRIAAHLEAKHGLPPVDQEMGGRFWPAVRQYFHSRHGMSLDGAPPLAATSSRIRVVPFTPSGKDSFNGQEAQAPSDRRHSGRDNRPRL